MHAQRNSILWVFLLIALWGCGEPTEGPGTRAKSPSEPPRPPAATPQEVAAKKPPRHKPETVWLREINLKSYVSAGAVSVYQLLKAHGDSTACYADAVRAFPGPAEKPGLEPLAKYLSDRGAGATVRTEPLAAFLAADRPGILRTTDGKLLVVLGRSKQGLRVVDPLVAMDSAMSADDLAARYGGANLRLASDVKKPAVDAPDVICEQLIANYGRIPAGPKHVHRFRLSNAGTRPLTLSWMQNTANCCRPIATISYTRDPSKPPVKIGGGARVAPGETIWLVTEINTRPRRGKMLFSAGFATNDPEEPEVRLFLSGHIYRKFLYEPQGLWFVNAHSIDGASLHLWVRHHKREPFTIKRLRTSVDHVTAVLDPDSPRQRSRPLDAISTRLMPQQLNHPETEGWVGIKVTVRAGAPVGQLSGKVSLECDEIPLEVPMAGRVIGNVGVSPQALAFGTLKVGEPHQTKLRVSSRLDQPFKVKRVEVKPAFIKAEVVPVGQGAYDVILRLEKGWQARGIQGRVIIHTNDPLEPAKKVSIYGLVRQR